MAASITVVIQFSFPYKANLSMEKQSLPQCAKPLHLINHTPELSEGSGSSSAENNVTEVSN